MLINHLRRLFKRPHPLGHYTGRQDTPPPENRMIILGNAPMKFDMSNYVNASALVVRFNDCKNYEKGTGSKVNFLCLTNLGELPEKWISKKTIEKLPFISAIDEIWIPRAAGILLPHRIANKKLTNDRHFDEKRFRDLSDELISSNKLGDKKIVRLSEKLNKEVLDNLKNLSPTPFREPSTGILTIAHILSDERFSGYEKIILGFTFKGWNGHPWAAEQLLVQKYIKENKNIALI